MTTVGNSLTDLGTSETSSTNEELLSSGIVTPTGVPGTPTKNSPVMLSPSHQIVSDRFIPLRDHNNWQNKLALEKQMIRKGDGSSLDGCTYFKLLRNEIFGTKTNVNEGNETSSPEKTKLFQYMSPKKDKDNSSSELYSLSPLSDVSQKILQTPSRALRKIPRLPFKVLDAPELQDDFYLNLVDWSSQNILSVGLGSSVYLWSAATSQVTRLCNLESDGNLVTSVSWNKKGDKIAVGTHFGYIQVWDTIVHKKVNVLTGHGARIGSLSWNGNLLASGSRDRFIFLNDVRVPRHEVVKKLLGHRQEVCGLKWSPEGLYLASGGNDNKVLIWNLHSTTPVQSYTKHTAAVKAIAWSPHNHGLLASGGGTADRCIRFWNTLTGQPIEVLDTGSQVCNIAWSKNSPELVSTHGYTQNQIYVWDYPSLTQIAKLMGHTYRVLYLAVSPNGETIVTGAGDETLRFWNVFSKAPSLKGGPSGKTLGSLGPQI